MRALVAISVPIPGIHGVTLDDVEYAAPKHGTEAMIMKEIPRLGRIVALRLREKESLWESSIVAYKKAQGVEVSAGLELCSAWRDSVRLAAGKATTRSGSLYGEVGQLIAKVPTTSMAGPSP